MPTKPQPPGVEPTCLYPTETEIAKLVLGGRSSLWPAIVAHLEPKGLPPIDPLFQARYWPAVREYFDRRNRISDGKNPLRPPGEENPEALITMRGRRRPA